MTRSQPLAGVRVADFTQLYQGPLATMILADLGADVVKIESPRGDFMRGWSLGDAYLGGESISFLSVNRNKRSVGIDLKHPDGREVAERIVAGADIVVENFRPGVMDRLGLGWDTLASGRPDLIYCASTGFGQSGPYREWPGQDLLVQAIAGTVWLNGRRDDPPTAVGFGIADITAGLHIVYGILAALLERGRSGLGQRVDVNLLQSLLTMQSQELVHYLNGGDEPVRPVTNGTAAYAGAPLGLYATRDGHIALAMMPVAKIARLLGVESLATHQTSNDVVQRDEIHAALEAAFRTRSTADWLTVLREDDVWCAPVQQFSDVAHDPQVLHGEMLTTVKHPRAGAVTLLSPAVRLSATPSSVHTPPPSLGEHTDGMLTELGYADAERAALIDTGAVHGPRSLMVS